VCIDFILLVVKTYLTRCWRSSLNMMFIQLAVFYHLLSFYKCRPSGKPGIQDDFCWASNGKYGVSTA